MKELMAISATLLIFAAYFPYVRDIIRGKTRPHPYTWLISGSITFIAFGLQVDDAAGWGMVPTFLAASAGILVFILSVCYKRAAITSVDTVFFLLALIATGLWLYAHEPILAAILISTIDILAFVPTFRKSWRQPQQETVATYYLNAGRFMLATLAIQHYNLATTLYPASAIFVDGSFALFLILRRRTLAPQSHSSVQGAPSIEPA